MSMFAEIPLTQEELDKQEAREQASARKYGLDNLKASTLANFRAFWYSEKLPVDRHLAILGTNAASLFVQSRAVQILIASLDPTWRFLVPQYEVTINEDGSVTLGAKLEPDPNATTP